MSMEYLRRAYGVPLKQGRIFEAYNERGMVYRGRVARATHYVHSGGRIFHPTDGIVYYDDDGKTVLLDTREER